MTNEFKLLVASLIATCLIVLSLIAYNVKVHKDKMDAYYVCLDRQEKIIKERPDDIFSSTLYCRN